MNLERVFRDPERNEIQIEFAQQLYGNNGLTDDEMLTRWVNEGYAERFGNYLDKHPDIAERIFAGEDETALEELKKNTLLH